MNKKLLLLPLAVLVGVLVALTYYVFEFAVHHAISFVWDDVFDTTQQRWLALPLSLALGLVFFGVRHVIDKKGDTSESHSLGEAAPEASIKNFAGILCIGFFSLLAGASLGPEAILVPACLVIGLLIGKKVAPKQSKVAGALGGISLVALFAAFFHSFLIGLASVLLLKAKTGAKLTPQLWLMAALASGASALTLLAIDPTASYFAWPDYDWRIRLADIAIALVLVAVGYCMTLAIRASHDVGVVLRTRIVKKAWWVHGLLAGSVLGLLYVVGGQYVRFTGNQFIEPVLSNADTLGLVSLAGIIVIKIIAIGWSKALWYRGGMIFPTIFVASAVIAFVSLLYSEVNFYLWLIAILVGAFAADKKAKILL